ncbi:hypothetical protein FLBR109950_12860 [Flavobacterium branchiophilum]
MGVALAFNCKVLLGHTALPSAIKKLWVFEYMPVPEISAVPTLKLPPPKNTAESY